MNNQRKSDYAKSKEGLITGIYSNQKKCSIKRGHFMPDYCKYELREWILSQDNFDELYNAWFISGFDTNLTPSVDRIDDSKPYSLNNITLCTWEQNRRKGHISRKEGNDKVTKCVYQRTKLGEFVNKFVSVAEAQRKTGISNISKVCIGKYKSAGGFYWSYN